MQFLSASNIFNLLCQKSSCTGGIPNGKCTYYNEWGESTASNRWTGYDWKLTGSHSGVQENLLFHVENGQNITQFNKEKPKDVNMSSVGLGNTRILTDYGQIPPWTLTNCMLHVWLCRSLYLFSNQFSMAWSYLHVLVALVSWLFRLSSGYEWQPQQHKWWEAVHWFVGLALYGIR